MPDPSRHSPAGTAPSPPPGPVRVKVCGLRTPGEALAAAEAGADWIGLNFHPPSPRYVDIDTAAAIVAALPSSARAVGLFVDRPPSEVASVASRLGLRIVQLHGAEPAADLLALAGFTLIRAFRLADASSIDRMLSYLQEAADLGRAPDAVLVDAFVAGLPGGTGRSIADELLDALPSLPRLILAGGLTPENVGERVARVRPWMVDVAGGVESAPGRKDPARVAAFIRAASDA
jgi:phosphoribosylanthranilate isomerase